MNRSLRVRTAAIVAISFSLFLTAFFILTYIAVRDSYLARTRAEVYSQLHRIASLADSESEFNRLVGLYGSTGESQLAIGVFDSAYQVRYAPLGPEPLRSTFESLSNAQIQGIEEAPEGYSIERLRAGESVFVSLRSTLPIDELLDGIIGQFDLVLLLGIVCSVVIGYSIARLTLSPVDALIRGARELSDRRTESARRLPVPKQIAEIRRLAEAFNAVLDQREAVMQDLKTFTADAAHELRTPLTILKGELEVELRLSKDTEYSTALESYLEEVARLIAIVQDLLLLAEIESEGSPSGREDGGTVVRSLQRVVERLSPLAAARRIEVIQDFLVDVYIECPPVRFERLCSNLLENALQHGPASSTVTVRTLELEGVVAICFMDTGSGILEADREKLFNRFFRADRSRNRTSGGSGLGLAIAKSIADRYEMELSILSGTGVTTARILLSRASLRPDSIKRFIPDEPSHTNRSPEGSRNVTSVS